jgi:hypothetical protein
MEAVAQTGPETGAPISRGTTVAESTQRRSFVGTTPTRGAKSAAFVPPLRVQPDFTYLRDSLDDNQERRARLLLLAKGAALAHRLARPLAAESDDDQQS